MFTIHEELGYHQIELRLVRGASITHELQGKILYTQPCAMREFRSRRGGRTLLVRSLVGARQVVRIARAGETASQVLTLALGPHAAIEVPLPGGAEERGVLSGATWIEASSFSTLEFARLR